MLILFTMLTMASARAQNLLKIRADFVRALKSKPVADSIYNALNEVKNPSPIIIAYTGSASAMRAVHVWNPYYKIKYVKDAERRYAEAVQQEPHNIEIRFLRFSMEHYVPGFLGYNKNLQADKIEMLTQLHNKNHGTADDETVHAILNFLLQSKRCTPAEEDFVHQQLRLK